MATIADYYIQIIPSADGISDGLAKALDSSAGEAGEKASSSFGNKFSSGVGTAAKFGAAAFTTGFAAVAAGVGLVTSQLTSGISSVAEYADHVDKQSQKMNMSAQSYQEWSAVMQHCGTSMDSLQASIKTMSNAAENGNAAFEALGISQEEVASLSSEDLFSKTITALQDIDDETQRTYLAGQLLGRGATELGALLNTSAEDTQAMKDRVGELGGVLSNDAIKAGAAFKDSLQDMNTAMSGLKNNMAAQFLPSVTTVMDGLTNIFAGDTATGLEQLSAGVAGFSDQLSELIPTISEVGGSVINALIQSLTENSGVILDAGANLITQIANAIITGLPALMSSLQDVSLKITEAFLQQAPLIMQTGLSIITNLVNGMAQSAPTIIPTITNIVLDIVNVLISNVPTIIEAGMSLFKGLVEGLVAAIPEIVSYLPELIDTVITALTESAPLIFNGALEMFMAIVDSLPDIIDALVDALPEVIDSIVTFLTGDGLPQILKGAIAMFMGIVDAIPQIITTITQNLPTIVSTIVTGLVGALPQILSAALTMFGGLIQAIPQVISSLASNIPSIISGIVSALSAGLGAIRSVGANLLSGLWSGISDKAQWVYSQITGLGQGIINRVKSLFGIHSPSRVFAEIGENLAAGLGVGWEDEIGNVKNDIGKDLAFKGTIETSYSNTPANNSLAGTSFTMYETIQLGDTQLKEIVSKYTIQQVGNETRAVKVAQGGYY